VAEAYINYSAGNDFTKQASSLQQQYSVKKLGDGKQSDTITAMQSDIGKKQTDRHGQMRSFFSSFGNSLLSSMGVDTRTDEQKIIDTQQGTLDAYSQLQKNAGNGLSDPAIEAAMQRFGGDQSTMIKVQSKDGDKVVSLKDAITYYPDQLSKGSASVASKDPNLNGKKLTDITGVKDVGLGPMADSSTSQNFGTSAADWEKDNPVDGAKTDTTKDDGSGSGKVTIGLSPEVARYFSVTGTGVNIDAAAAANVPPQPGGN
jgi:hypothetical protein